MKTIQLTDQQLGTLREMLDARLQSLTERQRHAAGMPARLEGITAAVTYTEEIEMALVRATDHATDAPNPLRVDGFTLAECLTNAEGWKKHATDPGRDPGFCADMIRGWEARIAQFPQPAPAKDAEQIADENAEFSYDFHGINGNDDYRSRLATLTTEGRRLNVGPLFAQAPALLGICREILTSYHGRLPTEFLSRLDAHTHRASRKQ